MCKSGREDFLILLNLSAPAEYFIRTIFGVFRQKCTYLHIHSAKSTKGLKPSSALSFINAWSRLRLFFHMQIFSESAPLSSKCVFSLTHTNMETVVSVISPPPPPKKRHCWFYWLSEVDMVCFWLDVKWTQRQRRRRVHLLSSVSRCLRSCSYLTRGVEWVTRCLDRWPVNRGDVLDNLCKWQGHASALLCRRSPFFCLPSLCRVSVFSGLFALPGGKTCLSYVCEGAPHYSTTSHS